MSDAVLQPTPSRGTPGRVAFALIAVAVVASVYSVYHGWRTFWFLTDDAFIAFRYVSNSMLGHGWVWNPPPFQPVEGYTSFLWVLLLDGVWRATGVAPPDSANWLSLGFGYATLFVGYRFAARMTLPASHQRIRWLLVAGAALGIVSNRTFLTWLSSGLETSLFGFALSCWIYFGLTGGPSGAAGRGEAEGAARSSPLSILGLTASAAAVALTRPDGLLFCAATLPLLALRVGRRELPRAGLWMLWGAPLLVVPLHLVWRYLSYGMWLPNTYYAKVTGAWPEAGLRYLACFALEYGLWVWLALGVGALVAGIVVGRRKSGDARREAAEGSGWRRFLPYGERWIVCAALAAHIAYYTLIVGGDHFEYRVYSHLILWLFLSGAWFAARLGVRPALSASLVFFFVFVSWPIPWLHWSKTRALETRAETRGLTVALAAEFPPGLRAVVAQWDEWQEWLIRRSVGRRHQEHKIAYQAGAMFWPTREEGAEIAWEERAVLAIGGVGAAAWALPHVAIIDEFGLNDRVIAQNPVPTPRPRSAGVQRRVRVMAHERRPPPGYVECFLPNVIQPYLASSACVEELMERPVAPGSVWRGSQRKPVEVHRVKPPILDEHFGSCDRLLVVERKLSLQDARIRVCDGRRWY